MRLSTLTLTLASLVSAAFAAPSLSKRATGVLSLDFSVVRSTINETENVPEKRSNDNVSLTLLNEKVFYLTYLEFGSSSQRIGVNLDTGSSDLWVPTVSSTIDKVKQYGAYDSSKSSNYKDTGETFFVYYYDLSSARGDFVTDDIQVSSGVTVKGFQFGAANVTSNSSNCGTFGIGKQSLEAPVALKTGKSYINFPLALKNDGYINKVAYSLYLNSLDADTGTVLFGGKDTAKIDGDLVMLPMTGQPQRISADLDSISIAGDPAISFGESIVFDTGSTFTWLPSTIQKQIVQKYGSVNGMVYQGLDVIWCPASTDKITFNFKGVSIDVPAADYSISLGSFGACVLTILGRTDGVQALGDNFLRHAYTIIDLEDNTVSLGKVKYTTDSNIVPL